jgi:N-methylhydantoinase A
MSVERGYDPRQMTLVAFGGAGPLHALDVARTLEIPRVVVPPCAGVWSAYGILGVDIQYATQRTWLRLLTPDLAPALHEVLETMAAELSERAMADGFSRAALMRRCRIDLRVKGQSHSLTVRLDRASPDGIVQAIADFHIEHRRRYSHAFPELPVEIVNIRLELSALRPAVRARPEDHTARAALPRAERRVWFGDDRNPRSCPIFERHSLSAGTVVVGPAIIEQYDTTIVLDPGDRLQIKQGSQSLSIDVAKAAGRAGSN